VLRRSQAPPFAPPASTKLDVSSLSRDRALWSPFFTAGRGSGAERRPSAPTTTIRKDEPAHEPSIDGFWIDRCAVNNEQFGGFLDETGWPLERCDAVSSRLPMQVSRQWVWGA
jgi:hypothetical protein